jgi:SAM-dependent methyltransferase
MGLMDIRSLYRNRFHEKDLARKDALWKILCERFFQGQVAGAVVLDAGAGACEFINHIRAERKIAVDMNPDVRGFAAKGVEVFQAAADRMPFLADGSVDTVFMSNLLEHMENKSQVMSVLGEARRVLRPGGRLLILQPNIRLVGMSYWDFFDHRVPLTDKSLAEAVTAAGFYVRRVIPGFLPYTTKSRLPQWGILVRIYLRLPFLWRIFGKQTFLAAEK